MRYTEIIKKNKQLSEKLSGEKYRVALISNITIAQLKEVLELSLRENEINAEVTLADYDAIVQESERFSNFNAVVIFWELINLIDGLQSKIYLMSQEEIDKLENKLKSEIDFVFKSIKNVPLVIINQFSSTILDSNPLKQGPLQILGEHLNKALKAAISPTQVLVDVDSIYSKFGIEKCRDLRHFYSSKMLYTVEYFRKYSEIVLPAFRAVNGKTKKVLVLDCDNTLWDGIIGEDGETGIQMNDTTMKGKVFKEIQTILLEMQNEGVLLALCSKNNEEDVNKILNSHPDMLINDKHLVAKKINWKDKASNIRDLALELNLGLDSFVFIDDSNFEVGLVKKELPMVEVLQVPADLSEYPLLLKELKMFFFSITKTEEDKNKTAMYLQEQKRKEELKSHNSIDNYLASLGLSLSIHWNQPSSAPRVSQMTQKTNQFNLTTQRYTESDIIRFFSDSNYMIAVFSVSDNYGDYGYTGMCIIHIIDAHATIDSLLMSCRVIGRNIEYAFFDQIIKRLSRNNIKTLQANYLRTAKNNQVAFFYDKLGFEIINSTTLQTQYSLNIKDYKMNNINYININE
jgi:FkbH-like protein